MKRRWWWEEKGLGWKTFGKLVGTVRTKDGGIVGMLCCEEGCSKPVPLYRQCADNKCKKEIGYCTEHGGDDRIFNEMVVHMKKHKDKDTQS